uniref:Uncharacterized protein n=1 Tax=Fagus sylvatica TaxID=28930 RepID=A0A2N9J217_FAGSY
MSITVYLGDKGAGFDKKIKEIFSRLIPYLQTVIPKLHDEDEQGPPECWAAVVVALEWCWFGRPWQTSWSFPFLSHPLNQFFF